MKEVSVKILRQGAHLPIRGSTSAAGADLFACLEAPITIKPGETCFISTGLAMAIPEGWVGLVFARSGLACKQGIAPANKVGVIDADYRGELLVALLNHSSTPYTVQSGDRIAQLVIVPCLAADFCPVDNLSDTQRGECGFGSTGVHLA